MKQRVAIIGAGAAGLCAAKNAAADGQVQEVVVFEQTTQLGGTWVYTDKTGRDVHGLPIHSSMYRDMK
jgi:cation diffusion facilitator CzcD-associated flavoprotein CzcO